MQHVRAYQSRDTRSDDRDPHTRPIRSAAGARSAVTPRALGYALLDRALGAGALPDPALRAGARLGARMRIAREERGGVEAQEERTRELVRHMSSGPIAEHPAKANEQHYELPGLFLGPRRKYSACLWRSGVDDLAAAEE